MKFLFPALIAFSFASPAKAEELKFIHEFGQNGAGLGPLMITVDWDQSFKDATITGLHRGEINCLDLFEKFDGTIRITSRKKVKAEINGEAYQWKRFLIRMRVPDIDELSFLRRSIDPESKEPHLIRDFTLNTSPTAVKSDK